MFRVLDRGQGCAEDDGRVAARIMLIVKIQTWSEVMGIDMAGRDGGKGVGLCRGVRDTYRGQNQVGLLFSIGMHITTYYQQRTESVEYKRCAIPQASCYRESINITRQTFKEVRLV
jgi:hypothetical protein